MYENKYSNIQKNYFIYDIYENGNFVLKYFVFLGNPPVG